VARIKAWMGFGLAVLVIAACSRQTPSLPATAPVALRFGEYARIKQPEFTQYIRESIYVPVSDGMRLALDIVRPAVNGAAVAGKRAVILEITPYGRAWRTSKTGELRDCLACQHHFWRYGYITAALDSRGTGASFGTTVDGPYTRQGGRDAREIIEWLAQQSWSNGRVGMVGSSFAGRIQFHAASEAPKALKALMPAMAGFDNFDGHAVRGGMVSQAALAWAPATATAEAADPQSPAADRVAVAAVDADTTGKLRDEARALNAAAEAKEQRFYNDLGAAFPGGMGRDELKWGMQLQENGFVNHADLVPLLNQAQIPLYVWQGWIDAFIVDGIRWFDNFTGSRKITIGNWPHGIFTRDGAKRDPRDAEQQRLYEAESLRWFDYWLLDKDTGIMNDPVVNYTVEDSRQTWVWRSAPTLDFVKVSNSKQMLLSGGESAAKGALVEANTAGAESTRWKFDPSATTGRGRSWETVATVAVHKDFGLPEFYPDLAANDRKGAAFSSAALSADVELFGATVLEFYLSADAADSPLAATLSEVLPDGRSRYLSEASMRGSFRTLSKPPYKNFDWPWLSGLAKDAAQTSPLNRGPVKVVMTFEPIARRVLSGNQLRVTLHAADADNFSEFTLPEKMPTQLTVYHSQQYPSKLLLPIVSEKSSVTR
jgi:uncharacterized protein